MENKKPYFKIDTSRLQTTDEHGNRVYVHPEDLKGRWKSLRLKVYWVLIGVYLVLPWIYIDGKQWVMFNIAAREFTIFGNTFLGHDTPYLIFLLLGFAFFIAIVTVLGGRVWCGWACPQTVFLDSLFRKAEVFVEGNSRERRKLQEAPWNKEKILKKSLKWFLFAFISTHITHSFLGYFVGTHHLLEITSHSPLEHWPLFLTMLFINAVVLFNFGWFREQFCIIMCPYGRFQSVLMDENSLVVAYNEKRGEPRKAPHDSPETRGDCVNCFQCVRVCPTGIDIRNGTQMECIACTACIDACDSIMEKINKPSGLISYTTEAALSGKSSKFIRPRLFVYSFFLIALFITTFFLLKEKDALRLLVLRGGSAPFSVIEKIDGSSLRVMNHLKLEFYVQSPQNLSLYFELDKSLEGKKIELITPHIPFVLNKKGRNVTNIFIKFPKDLLINGSFNTNLHIYQGDNSGEKSLIMEKEISLIGPF